MKILGFIACIYLVIAVNGAVAGEFDEITNFPGSPIQIRTQCPEPAVSRNCLIYASGNNKERLIAESPSSPVGIYLKSDVFEIRFACGTECSAVYFYSDKKGVGGLLPFVEAFDADRGVVLISKNNPLSMYAIFSKKSRTVGQIKLDISKEKKAFTAIKEVVVEDHHFVITYVDRHENVVTIRREVPNLTKAQAR